MHRCIIQNRTDRCHRRCQGLRMFQSHAFVIAHNHDMFVFRGVQHARRQGNAGLGRTGGTHRHQRWRIGRKALCQLISAGE